MLAVTMMMIVSVISGDPLGVFRWLVFQQRSIDKCFSNLWRSFGGFPDYCAYHLIATSSFSNLWRSFGGFPRPTKVVLHCFLCFSNLWRSFGGFPRGSGDRMAILEGFSNLWRSFGGFPGCAVHAHVSQVVSVISGDPLGVFPSHNARRQRTG